MSLQRPLRLFAIAAALAALLVLPAAASAVPQLLAPENGARVNTSSPLLQWSLDEHEAFSNVEVSWHPLTDENDFFALPSSETWDLDPQATAWGPSGNDQLPAGHYYWHVRTVHDDGSQTWSDMREFTVTVNTRIQSLTARWKKNAVRGHFDVSTNAQAQATAIRIRIGKLRCAVKADVWVNENKDLGKAHGFNYACVVHGKPVKAGTKVTVTLVTRAGGVNRSRTIHTKVKGSTSVAQSNPTQSPTQS